MRLIGKALDLYCQLAKALAVLCMVVMVVLVFGNVVLRYGFNSGIIVSEELSRWLLVWLTFFGAIVALREHKHLGVDMLVQRLSAPMKRVCFVLSHLLMLYASYLLLEGSWRQVLITAGDRAPATSLSVGFFYASGVVFGVSAMLILGYDLLRAVTGEAGEDELIAIRDSEEG
ncbi:MAG: TRAP transporter small permease [Rhizobiales bacterium]|nr:TRAP transporter small permease [Hyphomicrobiales bacterium]